MATCGEGCHSIEGLVQGLKALQAHQSTGTCGGEAEAAG